MARGLLLGGLLTACGRPETPTPDWAGVFYHPDTGMDTTPTAPPRPGRPRPWLAANWDPSSLSCEPVALPREPCEPDRDLPIAQGGLLPCTAHADCADDEFCGAGRCRNAWEARVLVCLHEASMIGSVEVHGEMERTPPDLMGYWSGSPNHFGTTDIDVRTEVQPNRCAPIWHRCETWQAGNLRGSTIWLERKAPGGGSSTLGSYLFGEDGYWEDYLRSLVNAGCRVVPVYEDYLGTVTKGHVVVSVHYPAPRHPPRPF